MSAQSVSANVELKVAIIRSRKTQRVIATRTRIPETRLSDIIRGRAVATDEERQRLSRVLDRAEADLFPAQERAAS